MFKYTRDVFYYETDKMAVVHHSNFLRWLEEARTAYYAEIGLPYEVTESYGIYSPVTGMNINFRHFARFGDTFTVKLKMTKYTGVRFYVDFEIVNKEGALLCDGSSTHAFVDKEYKPVSLSRAEPRIHAEMQKYVEA